MSKQVQVFLTTEDEANLFHSLSKEHDLLLARSVYWADDEQFVSSPAQLGAYPTDQQIALTLPSFRTGLLVTAYSEGHKRLDLINSPVIEFDRCRIGTRRVRCGRFWYQLESSDAEKGEEFKLWVRSFWQSLQRHLTSIQQPIRALIGSEALSLANGKQIDLIF